MFTHQIVDKREIENLVQMAIKVILRNKFLHGYHRQWGKGPLFETHHDRHSSLYPHYTVFSLSRQLSSPDFLYFIAIPRFYLYFSQKKIASRKAPLFSDKLNKEFFNRLSSLASCS